MQVVVNPLITRDCALAPTIFNLLNELGSDDVRFVPWLPYPRLGVAELEPPSGSALCGFLSGSNTPSNIFTLDCGAGNTIASVDEVIYGTSGGFCGSITPGACSSPTAKAAVSAACLGKQACTVVGNDTFMGGAAPCANPSTAVQVTCSGTGQHTYWNFTELDMLMADFMSACECRCALLRHLQPHSTCARCRCHGKPHEHHQLLDTAHVAVQHV